MRRGARCLGDLTHREYLTWQRWIELQWNEPSRGDYYLMQVAMMLRNVDRRGPKPQLKDHILSFDVGPQQQPRKPRKKLTKRDRDEMFKSYVLRSVGYRKDHGKRN